MNSLERLRNAAVVPVVVLENADDAVPTAQALLAGGVDVMEITFRTDAAADSIAAVSRQCPDMLVGAGTVITLEQCKKAVEMGAGFIVSPGFSEEVVDWCVRHDVAVTPGCVTPTEIMSAMSHGLQVVKFFPANVYGGLDAMKALSGPFGGIRFIPTGGVNEKNLSDYLAAPFIHAVGGSWLCSKADIAAHRFDRITELCRRARGAGLRAGPRGRQRPRRGRLHGTLPHAGCGLRPGGQTRQFLQFRGKRRGGHEGPVSGRQRPYRHRHQFRAPGRGRAGKARLRRGPLHRKV